MKYFIVLCYFLLSYSAHAVSSPSEFLFNPSANTHAFSVDYRLAPISGEVQSKTYFSTSTLAKISGSSNLTNFSYAYGLSNTSQFTVGFYTGKTSFTIDQTPNGGSISNTSTSGFSDVSLAYSGLTDYTNWGLFYSLNLSVSPGAKQVASTTVEGNNYSGQNALGYQLGIFRSGTSVRGGLGYLYKSSQDGSQIESNGTTSSISAYSTSSVVPFFEVNYGWGWISYYNNSATVMGYTTTSSSGTKTNTQNTSLIMDKLQVTYEITADVVLLAAISSESYINPDSARYVYYGTWTTLKTSYTSLGIRGTF